MNAIRISVIICTHNGGRYLKRAIESLASQSLNRKDYEIIVVDNCSTDSTKEIVGSLLNNVENLRYCYEPEIGLSHARNRGFREAKGELVAFLDDDAYASGDWLLRYIGAYEMTDPKPIALGGKILLHWEIPKPAWFPDAMQPCLTYVDYSQKPRFLDFSKKEYPFGANMVFSRKGLIELGGFDASLGRIGKRLLSNEELKLFSRIHEKGYKVYYVPEAYVYHTVSRERASKRYLYRRQFWQGISDVIWNYSHPSQYKSERVPYLTRLNSRLRALFSFGSFTESERVKFVCEIWYHVGRLVQTVRFFVRKRGSDE